MSATHRRLPRRTFIASLAALTTCTFAETPIAAERTGFWFVRHAQSEINVTPAPRAVADDGVTYPLTGTGVQQALALAEASGDVPVAAIYSSTRLRAVQTADAIAFRHGVKVTLAPEAVEIDDGIPGHAPDAAQMYRDLLRRWVVDRDLNARVGQGESLADAQRRFLPFVRELMNRHGDDRGVVIVVSHSGMLGALVPELADNVPADFMLRHPLPNGGIVKTELRDGRLFCTEWAGISHVHFRD